MLTDKSLVSSISEGFNHWQSEIEGIEYELSAQMGFSPEQGTYLTPLRRKIASAYVNDDRTINYSAYGAFVYGSLFYGYGQWCLNKARELNIKKIFCFTRESHLLVPLLKTLVQNSTEVEVMPLAVSRHFTRLISIERVSVSSLLKLFSHRAQFTGADFFDVLGINYEPNPYCDADTLVHPKQLKILLKWVISQTHLFVAISTLIAQQQTSFTEYLQSIGFFDEARVAICDLGWSGTTHRALRKFLKLRRHRIHITGLYLATTYKAVKLLSSNDSVCSYLIQYGHPESLAQALFRSPEILENITMPAHGSLKGMKGTTPVFSSSLLTTMQQQQAQDMQTGILAFVEQANRYYRHSLWTHSNEQQCNQLILLRSIISPTLFEIELFSHWHAEFNLGLKHIRSIIPDKLWLQGRFTNQPLFLLCNSYAKSKVYWVGAAMTQISGANLRDLFRRLQLERKLDLFKYIYIDANSELVACNTLLSKKYAQIEVIKPFINSWSSTPLSEMETHRAALYARLIFKKIGRWYRQIRYG
ncbi:hypothetical protein [Legionella pneumophila]|uniref:hypothetical protein n=1 Tax=Legionella pneumophila TaxID=446 RepID=UPI0007784ED9|nr:hypothetical protein [Legionella pneumophila]HAT8606376.1 hypothetical protein [Legionella pneumophila]